MYFDFTQITESVFETDICIIGAGATGFACAVSLLNSNLRVLVLEGGLINYNSKAADLQRAEVVNHPHDGIHNARERIVGGTTTKWGGQALPFMKEDFDKRDFVEASGWPISFDDLKPYYHKAEAILGTDSHVSFDYNPWKKKRIKEPVFSPSSIDLFVTKWCKIPNFAQQHGEKIEKSMQVTLLRNANVVEMEPNSTLDSVETLKIISLDKKEGTVHARYVIAAGGALETVRLFLNSKKFGIAGLGNNNGLVGHYFQDHVVAVVGQVFPTSRKQFHDLFDPFYNKSFKYFPRIRLSPQFALKRNILFASGQVIFTGGSDSLGSIKTILSILKTKQVKRIKSWLPLLRPSYLSDAGKAAFRWKIRKRGSSSNTGPIWLEIHSEQQPEYESYACLSDVLDPLGMPRLRLSWTISDLTVNTIKQTAKLIKEEFAKSGIGQVVLEPWAEQLDRTTRLYLADANHQAGGLRMSNQQGDGVVDASCRVHGIQNLYVASAAVFPNSSFSNPTMTAIALSIRISETIEKRIRDSH